MAYRRTSKTLRAKRYFFLRDRHFTPIESREFCKLTQQYPALKQLIATRGRQWGQFMAMCKRKGWDSEYKRQEEWKNWLRRFYETKRYKKGVDRTGKPYEKMVNWVVTNKNGRPIRPRISPWEWYDAVFQRLPDELKWGSPRSHRRVQQPVESVDRLRLMRWIYELEQSRDKAIFPNEKARFTEQIKSLRTVMKREGLRRQGRMR